MRGSADERRAARDASFLIRARLWSGPAVFPPSESETDLRPVSFSEPGDRSMLGLMGASEIVDVARLLRLSAGEDGEVALRTMLAELEAMGWSKTSSQEGSARCPASPELPYLEAPAHLDEASCALVLDLVKSLVLRIAATRERDQAQERAEMLSHASFEGLLLHRNGNVFDVNDRLSSLLGLPREELLGPSTLGKCVAPEDIPGVLERMRSGFEGSYVINGLRADGSRFRAELQSKQGALGSEPIRVAAVRDVTERERMWDLLRENEAQLRALVDTVFDVTVLSQEGRMIDVSETSRVVTGYSPEEMLGRNVLEFVAPEAYALTEEVVSQGMTGAYETVIISKSGDRVPVEIVATNTTLGGEPVRLAGVRDLRAFKEQERQREQLRKQMERAQRLDSLGALAGGVAHDFNNLLVGIMGNAEILTEDLKEAEQNSIATTILEASQRARELTGRLLAYSGKTNLQAAEPVDLAALFSELDRFTEISRPKALKITYDFREPCIISGDRASMTQVLLNLITNAVDAIGNSAGTITVSGKRVRQLDERWDEAIGAQVGPSDYVQLEVTDSGAGMDPQTVLRAFEPFFTTKSAGHGLGLAACLGILKTHGGAVHVKSQLGEGTTFSILLPASSDHPQRKPSHPTTAGESRAILIVDDQTIVRDHIARVLRRRGFLPLEASGTKACLEHLESSAPALILMDMSMPEGSGADVAAELRRRGVTTPIILTSGYVPESQLRAFDPGLFQGFLQKPYTLSELDSTIEKVLRTR